MTNLQQTQQLLEAFQNNIKALDQHTAIVANGVEKCRSGEKGAAGEQLLLLSDAVIACLQATNVLNATVSGLLGALDEITQEESQEDG